MSLKVKIDPPTAEQISFVRKELGTTEQDIKNTVSSLRSWLKMQPHLPDAIDDARIERMYINCKCSMERTKKALDTYFSLKQKLPELLMNRDMREPFKSIVTRSARLYMMPGMTDKGYRVLYASHVNPDPNLCDQLAIFKTLFMWAEVLLAIDYCLGDIIIFDAENVTAEHIVKSGVSNLRTMEIARRTAYTRRIKAIHIINAPKVIDMLVTLIKAAFPKKLSERVCTHLPGSKTLFDHITPEFVPEDLGGTGPSSVDLNTAYIQMMEEQNEWFIQQDHFVSDESKRPPDAAPIDDIFGVEGSFKKLSID